MHGVIDRHGGPDVCGVKHIPDGERQCVCACETVRLCVREEARVEFECEKNSKTVQESRKEWKYGCVCVFVL